MNNGKSFVAQQMCRKPLNSLPSTLSTEEAGMVLGMTPVRVSRLCNAGLIPAAKIGKEWRISTADLIAMFRGE